MSATGVDRLIELGKQQGFVTYSDLSNLLPETLSEAMIDECLDSLAAHGIRVVEDQVERDELCT